MTTNKTLFILLIWLVPGLSALAQDIPEPMRPYRLVNDFAQIFSSAEQQALEQKLLAYNDSTSTQIYVVTVDDLDGYPPSDYAFALGEKWGIGQKSKNNGAVILVKPRTNNSRGQAFIATGYGLEGRINDAYAGRIIRDDMIPYFKKNDYFGGVNAAIDAMIARLSGEFNPDDEGENEGLPQAIIILFIVLFLFFFILLNRSDQHINGGNRGNRGGNVFFPPISRGSGGWSGGSFGGGFGGGGGGSFGGGGAGGSW